MEVEFESKNFLRHGHDPKKCDVIVCWVHNWPECPECIEVVELRKEVESIGRSGDRKNAEALRRGEREAELLNSCPVALISAKPPLP